MQATDAEIAAFEQRAKAAAVEAAAAAAKAFPKGTKVTCAFSSANIPKGAVGAVQGLSTIQGNLMVDFPGGKATANVATTQLRRA